MTASGGVRVVTELDHPTTIGRTAHAASSDAGDAGVAVEGSTLLP
jgi:hypothetical protein